ncbi:hypothetical protein pdul_cds_390 [Pandoravirus dulcis]|uniref:Uncharacterized protein n=1 Tax=Pandoravirus dulcis TaxID=1349409 RepID=S4VWZ3_9VIRU|nr:hypothetical protein pdul_cds_390 [Pandoravirus dulcis]AGO82429.1 hypothetical protein pdul_cds_390 [Pandoravirus dulcis]
MADGARRLLHFVRVSADEARFSDDAPDSSYARLGEVSVAGRASVAPAPAVDAVVLWSVGCSQALHKGDADAHRDVVDSGAIGAHYRPLFKSAIQKCVRRQMTDTAARFARGLAEAGGVNDLLRRAAVILIEDAVVSPRLPILVWFMAASAKGIALTTDDLAIVADCMGQAAALTVRDCVPPAESAPHLCARLGSPGNHPIVDALLLRVCYGGTPGDMRMLARAASLWQARLTGSAASLWTESLMRLFALDVGAANDCRADSGDDAAAIDGLRGTTTAVRGVPEGAALAALVPVEAGDFHCFPRMCAEVAAAVSGRFTPEAIREAVWHHRSSLNFKRPWTDPRDPFAPPLPQGTTADVPDDRVDMDAVLRTARCWTAIAEHVDRIARRNIDRVASTTAAITSAQTSMGMRAGQKRNRATAQVDKRPSGGARPKATRQCLIRSFLAAPAAPRPS